MKVHRIDHVGIIVKDLAAAKAFFLDFGLELQGEGELEGEWLDKIVGLNNVKDAYAMLRTPDGEANIELIQFYRPSDESTVRQPLANALPSRHPNLTACHLTRLAPRAPSFAHFAKSGLSSEARPPSRT